MGDNEMYGNNDYSGPERRITDHVCKQEKALQRIEFKVDAMDIKVDKMRNSVYGLNGTGGVTGTMNWLKGGFAVVCILLTAIVGLSWNTMRGIEAHTEQMYTLQLDVKGLSKDFDSHTDTVRMRGAHDDLHREMSDGDGEPE